MLEPATPVSIIAMVMLTALVAVAGWTDIKQRRIRNWMSAATLVTGLVAVFLTAGGVALGWAAAHFIVALVVGMALTAFGVVGAGDAKFYAGLAAWLPIQAGLYLLISVALAGLVLLALFLMMRRGRIRKKEQVESEFDKLPYGVAIGIGGLVAVALA